jgi:hypothetical protein
LTSLKLFGVELTLSDALVRVNQTLATALSASEEQYFSSDEAIWGLYTPKSREQFKKQALQTGARAPNS